MLFADTATHRSRLLAVDVASGEVTNGIDVGSAGDPPVALTITPDGDRLIAVLEVFGEDGIRVAVRRYGTDLAEVGSAVAVGDAAEDRFGALGATEDGTAIVVVGTESADVHALPPQSDEAAPPDSVEGVGRTLVDDLVIDPAGTWVTFAHDHAAFTVDLTSGASGPEVPLCDYGLGADARIPGDAEGSVFILGTCNDTATQTPYVWILGPPS